MRIISLFLLFASVSVAAAQPAAFPDFSRWEMIDPGARTLSYLNRPSLYLERGIALLPGVQFADGSIEFDVAIHGHSGFAGVVFRAESASDYELIYLRTHRSRQWDALQYTPIFAGQEAWQLYAGAGYNAAAELPANRWLHVRIDVSGSTARVYIDRAGTPQLEVTDLKRPWARGRVGLWGRSGAAMFSNFTVTPVNGAAPAARPAEDSEPGVITRWSISPSFAAAGLPSDRLPDQLSWQEVKAERSGLVNIARFRRPAAPASAMAPGDARATVFARTILQAKSAERVRLSFGYSDDVVIFLDGRPLFAGQSGYLVRDGSYLGTLTLGSDAVFLELTAGRHELVFAVSEAFGGWGVAAKLESSPGVIAP